MRFTGRCTRNQDSSNESDTRATSKLYSLEKIENYQVGIRNVAYFFFINETYHENLKIKEKLLEITQLILY
jgi:hypothetical protein